MRALLVPADPTLPPGLVELRDFAEAGQVAELVGGWPVSVRYDLDATLLVDDNGIAKHRRVNQRVTDYICIESHAAASTPPAGSPGPRTT